MQYTLPLGKESQEQGKRITMLPCLEKNIAYVSTEIPITLICAEDDNDELVGPLQQRDSNMPSRGVAAYDELGVRRRQLSTVAAHPNESLRDVIHHCLVRCGTTCGQEPRAVQKQHANRPWEAAC